MPNLGQLIRRPTPGAVNPPAATAPPADADYDRGAELARGAIRGRLPSWGDRSRDRARFMAEDEARRRGEGSSTTDRVNEGALMASTLGPLAPAATLPIAAVGAGYEAVKGLGQATGLGRYFPGPFKQDETTSPASVENVVALMRGYTTGSGG